MEKVNRRVQIFIFVLLSFLLLLLIVCARFLSWKENTTFVGRNINEWINTIESLDSCSFKVVWNVPDETCIHAAGLNLTDDILRYGFIRNTNNKFRGDRISLIYTPGQFPRLVESPNGQLEPINGGVPQMGNLQEHLADLQEVIQLQVPDSEYEGMSILCLLSRYI